MSLSIPPFTTIHALVIGDVMLDRYWHGTTSRISPEAPVPIVHVTQQEERPGGAGNVALNIAALGAKTTLIGVTGKDEASDQLVMLLTAKGVECALNQVSGIPTITKLRILSRHQQLIRLDFEDNFSTLSPQILYNQVQTQIEGADIVVLSDYGKGTLADPASLIALAHRVGKPILVDPKGRDFNKYRGATIITPNLAEFETIVGACPTEAVLVEKGEALRDSLQVEALLITRSEQGMTLLQRGHTAIHLPAHAHEVYDVTGAGDTVIAVLAATFATTHDWLNAVTLANLAAGLVVAKLGAATVTIAELAHALHMQTGKGVHDANTLQVAVNAAKANSEIVVMTNGCFDILHAGHIHYLKQARQLGDRLIVAVNDDDSVRRLKGMGRPINPVAQRMAVLNALSCVDWVVPFAEDTPEQLIRQITPDILVKGGDYQVHQIVGGEWVRAQGGRVVVLDFVEGCSTTATLAALQRLKNNVDEFKTGEK